MSGTSPSSPSAATTGGGVLLAVAGALMVTHLLGTGEPVVPWLLADVALALGAGVLALRRDGVVRGSRVGRIALVVFGVGPLLYRLPPQVLPTPVLPGTTLTVLIAIATVVTAVSIARAGVLRGVARWMPVLLAADAVQTAAMSSVALGDLPLVYLGWHLELLRPTALLLWGLSVALHGHGPAIRRRLRAIDGAWKRSTDVGGTASGAPVDAGSRR